MAITEGNTGNQYRFMCLSSTSNADTSTPLISLVLHHHLRSFEASRDSFATEPTLHDCSAAPDSPEVTSTTCDGAPCSWVQGSIPGMPYCLFRSCSTLRTHYISRSCPSCINASMHALSRRPCARQHFVSVNTGMINDRNIFFAILSNNDR